MDPSNKERLSCHAVTSMSPSTCIRQLPSSGEVFRGMRGTVHVVFEEGTQAQWLYDLLVPLVHRVVVCDRHGEKRRGNKGDRVDAAGLSGRLWRSVPATADHQSG